MQTSGDFVGYLKWALCEMPIWKLYEIYGKSKVFSRFTVNEKRWIFLALSYSSARIFFGKGAVMAKALGTTPEEEHRAGLSNLAKVRRPSQPFSFSWKKKSDSSLFPHI